MLDKRLLTINDVNDYIWDLIICVVIREMRCLIVFVNSGMKEFQNVSIR